MNYNQTVQSVELVIAAGEVPLLVGATGIGKTTLANDIAKKNGWPLVCIDGNLLKEGEIGGLPTVKNEFTVYAMHYKLQQIKQLADLGKTVLVFIDEINRCEHAVQQELMNLILNREINGCALPPSTRLIAAMNPSDTYAYETVEMDKAQENRFVWLYLEPDYLQWLHWAESAGIEPKIREFIATYPDYLQRNNEDISATPRSYARISKLYTIYKENPDKFSKEVFFNVLQGNVGKLIATELMNFLGGEYRPLIKFEDVFGGEGIPASVKLRVKEESPTRLYLTMHNIIQELDQKLMEGDLAAEVLSRWIDFLELYPVDLQVGLMKEVRNNTKKLGEVALADKKFIESYFKAQGVTA